MDGMHELEADMTADDPATTNAVVALLIREMVARIRPEVAMVALVLDELAQLADELEAGADAPHAAGSDAGDLLAVMACHLPNEVRGIAGSLRRTHDLFWSPAVTEVLS